MPSLRLLCLNARTLELDRPGLARLIDEIGPGLACLHGAPSLLRWRAISAELAREAGMVVVGGGRLGGGNLLLSTLGVDVLTTQDVTFAGGHGPRRPGAALAVLRLGGVEFVAAGARLAGERPVRVRQAVELDRAVTGLVPSNPPAVLSVDGVDEPSSGSWRELTVNRTAVTDGVFVDDAITVIDANQIASGAVRVELTFG